MSKLDWFQVRLDFKWLLKNKYSLITRQWREEKNMCVQYSAWRRPDEFQMNERILHFGEFFFDLAALAIHSPVHLECHRFTLAFRWRRLAKTTANFFFLHFIFIHMKCFAFFRFRWLNFQSFECAWFLVCIFVAESINTSIEVSMMGYFVRKMQNLCNSVIGQTTQKVRQMNNSLDIVRRLCQYKDRHTKKFVYKSFSTNKM